MRRRNKRKQWVEAWAALVGGCVVSWQLPREEPTVGGSGRFRGSSLEGFDESDRDRERLIAGVQGRVEEERVKLARFKELFQQRHALYEEQAWLRRERIQVEQKVRALEQRAERERLRSERPQRVRMGRVGGGRCVSRSILTRGRR